MNYALISDAEKELRQAMDRLYDDHCASRRTSATDGQFCAATETIVNAINYISAVTPYDRQRQLFRGAIRRGWQGSEPSVLGTFTANEALKSAGDFLTSSTGLNSGPVGSLQG